MAFLYSITDPPGESALSNMSSILMPSGNRRKSTSATAARRLSRPLQCRQTIKKKHHIKAMTPRKTSDARIRTARNNFAFDEKMSGRRSEGRWSAQGRYLAPMPSRIPAMAIQKKVKSHPKPLRASTSWVFHDDEILSAMACNWGNTFAMANMPEDWMVWMCVHRQSLSNHDAHE